MEAKELRLGNWLNDGKENFQVEKAFFTLLELNMQFCKPIPLTEVWLLNFGFSVINENSAGKRYGCVINGIFNSDLTFIFWKSTKEEGKFFRKDLELNNKILKLWQKI